MQVVENRVPEVTFKTRVRDASIDGDNPFRWQDVSSAEIFSHRRVIVFALPSAVVEVEEREIDPNAPCLQQLDKLGVSFNVVDEPGCAVEQAVSFAGGPILNTTNPNWSCYTIPTVRNI